MATANTGDLITRVYGNFRGVDFRGEEINIVRSPDCLNVWKDYREINSIRTRPGMKLNKAFYSWGQIIYGIFFYNGQMLVHNGTKLFKVEGTKETELYNGLNQAPSNAFMYENIWYFKDGKNYLQYDGTTVKEVVGYVPTTSIGRNPAGGGKIYEDVNLLTGRRINTFLADGESVYYNLDAQNIDQDFIPRVKYNGEELTAETHYLIDYEAGIIRFVLAPEKPLTDGQDNVSIEFKKTIDGYADRILKCNLLQVFDNRVFFSGNKDYPNTVWHCSLNDPTYCSDLDYYHEGMDSAQIKGLVAGNNALWVFREPSEADTTIFYHTPTIDEEYGKIYPSTHSSVAIGCVGAAINFNDDIVFFSERGMEGISGDVTTEQVVAHRSTLVDRKLIAEPDYKNMKLIEWEGYLLVIIGNKIYLADSRTAFTNENHIEYDWFYWEMEETINSANVYNGVLYLGTVGCVYTLTDTEKDLESYWVTPKDKFNSPHKLKTTNKRGCVVEAEGDVSVYVKIEDSEFEHIGTYENITDFFVSRIKRKKFKDLQLKFHSSTRFSLETATLECFIGGYAKRSNATYTPGNNSVKPSGSQVLKLRDRVTGQTYQLYIEGGDLIMEKPDNNVTPTNTQILAMRDIATGEGYKIYIDNEQLTMEKPEG